MSASLSMIRCDVAHRLRRLAPQKVWGEESETGESDGHDVGEGASGEEHGAMQRSGKLLVLKQLLPLWHTQVGFAGARVEIQVLALPGVGLCLDVYPSHGTAAFLAAFLRPTLAYACEDRARGPF